jgi:hypothetical protein
MAKTSFSNITIMMIAIITTIRVHRIPNTIFYTSNLYLKD